jgi:hypothetical protein
LDIREQTKGISLSNGEYWIKLDSEPLKVHCDMEEDGGKCINIVFCTFSSDF